MGQHDEYEKNIMTKSVGNTFADWGPTLEVHYGGHGKARIDGTIGNNIAVEIESRVSKQIRGALLDLICHEYAKKLLVLMPVHMDNVDETAKQCRFILGKFI